MPTRFGVAAETRKERMQWAAPRRAESEYARLLRRVARQVGDIVDLIADHQDISIVEELLNRYAQILQPWAVMAARRMLADVSRRDTAQWNRVARTMSRALREEVATAPTGEALQRLMLEQVDLITSLPRKAAERVHKLAIEARTTTASRGEDIVQEIMNTGHVTKSRAELIARTETARAASVLVQVRAEHIGATHYTWTSAGDYDVRPLHKALNGKVIAWSEPPVSGERGERAHAGQIYNCRCIAIPIIPDMV